MPRSSTLIRRRSTLIRSTLIRSTSAVTMERMGTFVGAAEATRILGVRPETLYAYVSREKLRVIRTPGRKARQYLLADVERLLSRSEARRGHAAVAAAGPAVGGHGPPGRAQDSPNARAPKCAIVKIVRFPRSFSRIVS